MDRETATEIANTWDELAAVDETLRRGYHGLIRLLMVMLPDDTEVGAGALVCGEPAVVAVAGDGLFLVTFETRDADDSPQPAIERRPLAPTQPTLAIREGTREHQETGPFQSRVTRQVREWTLTWPDGRALTFESVVRRFGGFDNNPDAAEGVGRAVAARLGWKIPS